MGATFSDWAWYFGHRLIKGNKDVAFGFVRDNQDVYRPSVMYNVSTINEVQWIWSDKINFNLG